VLILLISYAAFFLHLVTIAVTNINVGYDTVIILNSR